MDKNQFTERTLSFVYAILSGITITGAIYFENYAGIGAGAMFAIFSIQSAIYSTVKRETKN
jgi:hypothetical protein